MWDAWNIEFVSTGAAMGAHAHPTIYFGPFPSDNAAHLMANQMGNAGLIPATHTVRVQPAPKKVFGHDVLPAKGGGFVIRPYDVVMPTWADTTAWLTRHVAQSRKSR